MLDELGAGEESEIGGEAVFVEEADGFAKVVEGQAEGEGGADGVAVRALVGEDGEGGTAVEEGSEVGESGVGFQAHGRAGAGGVGGGESGKK